MPDNYELFQQLNCSFKNYLEFYFWYKSSLHCSNLCCCCTGRLISVISVFQQLYSSSLIMVFPPHKKPQENKQKQAEKRQPKPKQKKNSEELPVPKSFPMENGPDPSKLQAADLTWVYKVPDSKCKLFTEEDVVKYHGFKIEDKVSSSD